MLMLKTKFAAYHVTEVFLNKMLAGC